MTQHAARYTTGAMHQRNGNGHRRENGLSLVYIIGTYPGLTTTFIDREIRTLRRWGVELQVVAIRRPRPDIPLSQDQRDLQRGVIYLLPIAWVSFLVSHLYFALFRPKEYLGTLGYLLTRPHPTLRARMMTFLHFGEGVYAAYLVRERHFHELYAHFVDRAATVALVAGRLLHRPYSLSIHAGADIFVSPVLLPEKVREARHVVTCTAYNKAQIERVAGREFGNKISRVYHGLDIPGYTPLARADNGRPLILGVGQLAERKGFAYLVKACGILRERGYDFSCQIVGQGPQQAQLEALIRELGLEETVTLCGALPHETVVEMYGQATIFVLPCVQSGSGDVDGFPNVLAEAMAMELPVISTAVSAIPELLEDRANGLLVPPQDYEALADAMAGLLEDPGMRRELGKNGRRTVAERFDGEQNVRHLGATLWPEWFPSAVPSALPATASDERRIPDERT